MPSEPAYVRLTPDEYRALLRAAGPLPRGSPACRFRSLLAAALRAESPGLAERVASLTRRQVLAVRGHLDSRPEPARARVPCWTLEDWRQVCRAGSLFLLRGGDERGFGAFLLAATAGSALRDKLARLDAGRLAELYRRVRSGRRWCP